MFLFCMNSLTAQTAFSLKEIRLPKAIEEKVKLQVSEFQAYEINLLAFNNYLKKHAPTDSIPIKINIGTRHSIDCRVAEYEVRAKNCVESVVKAHETEMIERGRCDTYRELDSKVAHQKVLLFASAHYFSAHFYINTEGYELVSLASFGEGADNKNILIFYKRSKLKILDQPFNCGNANDLASARDTNLGTLPLPENNVIRFVELAIVADYEYYKECGINKSVFSNNPERIIRKYAFINSAFLIVFIISDNCQLNKTNNIILRKR